MELNVNVAEISLINQLVRDSREEIARFTKAKATPIHDRVVMKCERALDEMVRFSSPDGRKGG